MKNHTLSLLFMLVCINGIKAQTFIQSSPTNSGTGIINHPGSIDLGGWVKTRANAYFYSNEAGKTTYRLTFNLASGTQSKIYNYDESGGTFHSIKIGGSDPGGTGLTILPNGNVGINNTNPIASLFINSPSSSLEPASIAIQHSPNSRFWITHDNIDNVLKIGGAGSTIPALGALNIRNGSIGIGSLPAGYKLDVNGTARISGNITLEGQIMRSATAKTIHIAKQTDGPDFKGVAQLRVGTYLTLGNFGYGNRSWIGSNVFLTHSSYGADAPNGIQANKFRGFYAPGTGLVMNMDWVTGDFTGKHYDWSNTTDDIDLNNFSDSWRLGKGSNYFASKVSIGDTYNGGTHMLYVKGSILTEEVQVKLRAQWPDFVFDEDYKLMSLSETEDYIKENKHLPGVPSATQVQEEGVKLAEMNAILLQKIEELTIHLINQQKEIENLKQKIDEK